MLAGEGSAWYRLEGFRALGSRLFARNSLFRLYRLDGFRVKGVGARVLNPGAGVRAARASEAGPQP